MAMKPDPSAGTTVGAPDPRRRSERHATEALTCDLGKVVDLSRQGMKIRTTGKPSVKVGSSGKLKIKADGGSVPVQYVVKWISRVGFRKYSVGVQFVNMKPGLPSMLESIARFGFLGFAEGAGTASGAAPVPGSRGRGGPTPISRKASPNRIARTGYASRGIRTTRTLPDYYGNLGLPPNASPNDIQTAFRKLALRFHPDVARNASDAEKFHFIQEAYNVLKDPARRKAYDMKRKRA